MTDAPRVHILKTWPESFRALKSGAKKHEVRKDDRGFMVGDFLRLDEYEPTQSARFCRMDKRWEQPTRGSETGEDAWFRVTYKSAGGTWGLPADLCVLSVEPCEEPKGDGR